MGNWFDNAVIYHIYPLGFCGAPKFNEGGNTEYRLDKLISWIPHLKEMSVDAVYLGPVFESAEHGYDTTDYKMIDRRLGDTESFKEICSQLHSNGIRVILDGVFNHVGRNFFAFKDVQKNGSASKYCGWFHNLNFGGQSPCGDDFWYEGWNGHYNLVKLNLRNPQVVEHLFDAVNYWIDEFEIDGIRFDAADSMDFEFFKRIRSFCKSRKSDFWLMGEIIFGDYKRWANSEMLDSVTNYECYKGLYSSHNDSNYFEIDYSINRQFGRTGIYKGINLYNFADNHDVNRLASMLKNPEHIYNVYTMLYTMVGVPSIYYGSEYGIEGVKKDGSDAPLRPCLELENMASQNTKLYNHIVKLGHFRRCCHALGKGEYSTITVRNKQLLYRKAYKGRNAYIGLNLEDKPYTFKFDVPEAQLADMVDGVEIRIDNGQAEVEIPAYSSVIMCADVPELIEMPEKKQTEAPKKDEEVYVGRKYRHYKGNEYEVVGVAKHTETLEELVIYRALYGTGELWARPKSIFMDDVDGIKRFTLID